MLLYRTSAILERDKRNICTNDVGGGDNVKRDILTYVYLRSDTLMVASSSKTLMASMSSDTLMDQQEHW